MRYWSANGRPGMDMAFDEGQMKIGRRLAIKLLNASKFALGFGAAQPAATVPAPLDRSMLAGLADLVDEATAAFDRYDYARALERTETHFWSFCDDYLELVKSRAYGDGDGRRVGQGRARLALEALLGLFAPFLPFVTEEVWSWWREGSIHRSAWPDAAALRAAAGARRPGRARGGHRRARPRSGGPSPRPSSDAGRGGDRRRDRHAARLAALQQAADDVRAAGVIAQLTTTEGDAFAVEVELPPAAD